MMASGEIVQDNAHDGPITAIEHAKVQNEDIIFTAGMDNKLKAWKLANNAWQVIDQKDYQSKISSL